MKKVRGKRATAGGQSMVDEVGLVADGVLAALDRSLPAGSRALEFALLIRKTVLEAHNEHLRSACDELEKAAELAREAAAAGGRVPGASSGRRSIPPLSESGEFVKLGVWLKAIGLTYSTYRTLRAKGKAPAEIRLSKRTILISRQAADTWRRRFEASSGGAVA